MYKGGGLYIDQSNRTPLASVDMEISSIKSNGITNIDEIETSKILVSRTIMSLFNPFSMSWLDE